VIAVPYDSYRHLAVLTLVGEYKDLFDLIYCPY
jgi:hypothetical protein